jgi:hypothetical protein
MAFDADINERARQYEMVPKEFVEEAKKGRHKIRPEIPDASFQLYRRLRDVHEKFVIQHSLPGDLGPLRSLTPHSLGSERS